MGVVEGTQEKVFTGGAMFIELQNNMLSYVAG